MKKDAQFLLGRECERETNPITNAWRELKQKLEEKTKRREDDTEVRGEVEKKWKKVNMHPKMFKAKIRT